MTMIERCSLNADLTFVSQDLSSCARDYLARSISVVVPFSS